MEACLEASDKKLLSAVLAIHMSVSNEPESAAASSLSSDALAVNQSADGLEKLSLTRVWPNFWTNQNDTPLCCSGVVHQMGLRRST